MIKDKKFGSYLSGSVCVCDTMSAAATRPFDHVRCYVIWYVANMTNSSCKNLRKFQGLLQPDSITLCSMTLALTSHLPGALETLFSMLRVGVRGKGHIDTISVSKKNTTCQHLDLYLSWIPWNNLIM